MNGTVAITDHGWYEFLAAQQGLDEVNFWTPSAHFALLAEPGSPFFFKLKARYHHAVCGFAFFSRFARVPDWLAWESFGEKNGSPSLEAMRRKIHGLRKSFQYQNQGGPDEIGCILLSQPSFFAPEDWVVGPKDWPLANLRNKKYDIETGEGRRLWEECVSRVASPLAIAREATRLDGSSPRYGQPQLVPSRLGQGTFRISVMDAYSRACALTGEHSLPALEAGHIRPYAQDGPHDVRNGVFLRADLHRLFDQGYVTITTDYRLEVSARLRLDYSNGRTYYPLHGNLLRLPRSGVEAPAEEFLRWHNEKVFRAA